ncbi:hypothetical protein DN752_00685 [Echinicola strongylocentroti]|uniref:Uncharacterized protein n=1 Tax=Echinicola strongylocentroti TaxID=1795355 RepID=A0A2Z4IDR2_9BACT|nr:hypothetical protein [Echinicola strongylocentroti]AWW28766.1 hypothetical protein DN752_00685 [Echinicola strongylocentroti]
MKNLLIALLVLFSFHQLSAKEVCWCAFEVSSENGQYIAKIQAVDAKKGEGDYRSDWKVNVFEVVDGVEKLLWQADYNYSGKSSGLLSNDGQYFTYVEDWYNKENPLIQIYKNGQKVHSPINGRSLDIPRRKLKKGELHYFWLTETGSPYAYEVDAAGEAFLVINTVDGQRFTVDLKHGTFSEQS